MGGNASPSYAYFLFRDKPTSVRTNPPHILNRDEFLTRTALILAKWTKRSSAGGLFSNWFLVLRLWRFLLPSFCLKLRSKLRLKVIWFYFAFLFHIMAFLGGEINSCLFFWYPVFLGRIDRPAVSECVRSAVDFRSFWGPRFVDAGRSPCFSFLIFSSQVLPPDQTEPRSSQSNPSKPWEGTFLWSRTFARNGFVRLNGRRVPSQTFCSSFSILSWKMSLVNFKMLSTFSAPPLQNSWLQYPQLTCPVCSVLGIFFTAVRLMMPWHWQQSQQGCINRSRRKSRARAPQQSRHPAQLASDGNMRLPSGTTQLWGGLDHLGQTVPTSEACQEGGQN